MITNINKAYGTAASSHDVLGDQFCCERKDVQHSRLTRGKLQDPSLGPKKLSISEPWTDAGYADCMETSSISGTRSA
jgi:hypothetical protein